MPSQSVSRTCDRCAYEYTDTEPCGCARPDRPPLRGLTRELADAKVREIQPATIEVKCCGDCGKAAYGSFGPELCRCPDTRPIVTALYRLVAVADA